MSVDLLAIDRGAVTAPAGCGKTHLIAEALGHHRAAKPVLVLTHTNAGVVALRGRLDRMGVPRKAYRLSTIDGWAMRLISTFPERAGHDPEVLKLLRPGSDYPNIRAAAAFLLEAGHINDILAASYARRILYEYHGWSMRQHSLLTSAAAMLPTCVLGDPMQAIFGFGGDELPDWETDVCVAFPVAGELDKPWRWVNAGAEQLGVWLLDARARLLSGQTLDMNATPAAVRWVGLDGTNDHDLRLRAARVRPPGGAGRVLIIVDSKNRDRQRQFASQTPGAVTVEAVDLRDLVAFATRFTLDTPDALARLVRFAGTVMTNAGGAELLERVESLARGTARKEPSTVEQAALAFRQGPSYRAAVDVLVEIEKQPAVRVHRQTVLKACIKALGLCQGADGIPFRDAAIQMREQNRLLGRPLPQRAVGSTLLLKGLEAEVSVVVDADLLDPKNLYVAMTRGSKALVVCSSSPILNQNR